MYIYIYLLFADVCALMWLGPAYCKEATQCWHSRDATGSALVWSQRTGYTSHFHNNEK